MIRCIVFAALVLALTTSAQALPRVPLHQPDGITTEVRYYGYGHRRYDYGYRHHGYRHYGYSSYRRYGYGGYGYRSYGYRPYGYGVARGVAGRNIRRGILW